MAFLVMVWCCCCCCYWRADSKTSVLNEEVLRKRKCLAAFSNLCCPERWSGMNRISHSDWVKIYVDPNGRIKLRAKQKYEILSATSFFPGQPSLVHPMMSCACFSSVSCCTWIVYSILVEHYTNKIDALPFTEYDTKLHLMVRFLF